MISANRRAIPAQPDGPPSSSEINATETPENRSAYPASLERSSPRNLMPDGNDSVEDITKTALSSSSVVTSVSDSNASIAWETVTEQDKANSVQEKLSEFEAILASITSHISPKKGQ